MENVACRKTDCIVSITNNLSYDLTIGIKNDPIDWIDGPETVLKGQTIKANRTEKFTLRTKDEYTRCWFDMDNTYSNGRIGTTHIEMKSNDKDKQEKTEERTESYTSLGVKVRVKINTPSTGAYSLDVTYSKI